MSDSLKRDNTIKDCFKVRKGLCVTGDAVISGNLTVSGGLNVIGPVSGDFKDPRFNELFTLVSESSACWNLTCKGSIVCDYTATAISYPVDEIDTVLIYTDTTPLSSVLYTPVGEPIVNSQQLLLFVQEVSGVVVDASSYAREPSVGEYGLTDDVLFDSVSGFTTTGRTQYKHDDLILGTDNFTIEAWVIPGPVDPDHRIRLFEQAVKHFNSGGGGGGSNDSNLTLMHEEGTAGKLRLRAYGGADVVSSNSMIIDQWNHVVVQRTGDVLELYINGVESGSLSLPDQYEFILDTMHVGNIGAEFASTSTHPNPESIWKWKGAISNFTITRNALYLTDFDVPTTSLTPVSSGEQPASWKFEGGEDQQVTFPVAAGTFADGEDFTIEFWTYRFSDVLPHENIMANESDQPIDGLAGWRILYNHASGEGYKFIHDQQNQVLNTGNVTNEEWHHVAFVRHDNNLFAYVDGNLMTCDPDVDRELVPYNVNGQVVIGGPGNYSQANSLFSDIQITKKALYTQQEGFTPPARFDACDEITIDVQSTHVDTQGESIFPETGDFAAEIWVYINELPTDPTISQLRLFTQQNLDDERKWTYLTNRMAHATPEYKWFQFVCNDGSGSTNNHVVLQNFESTLPMQAKTWHHVLIERKNVTEWSLYLDGVRGTTHDGTNWLGQNNYPVSPSGKIAQHTGPVQLPTWNTDPGVENGYILHRDFRVTTGGVCRSYMPSLPLETQAPSNIRPAKLLPQCVTDAEAVVLDTDDLTHDPESARIESIDGSTITFNQDVCDPEPLLYINYNYTSPGGNGNTTQGFRLENGYPVERNNGDQFKSYEFMDETTGVFQIALQTTQFTGGTTNSHRISRDPNGPWTDVSVETTTGVYQQKIGNYWWVTYRVDIGQQDIIGPSECKFPVGERVLLVESQHTGTIQDGNTLPDHTVGNYEFATIKSHVDSNKVELTQPLSNQYTVANYVYMAYTPRVKHLTVAEGAAITPSTWSRDEDKLTGLLWLNADTIIVKGIASATARGYRGGRLTSTSADAVGGRGEGITTSGYNNREVGGFRGGGGGGAYLTNPGDWGGSGSGGGNATRGQNGGANSTSSDMVWANDIMYKMFMGGGGGQGGCDGGAPYDSNPGRGGYGGNGGGIVIIDADYAEIVPDSGFVGSRGADGQNAYDPGDSEPGVGGSGAGGTVLFTGDVINVDTISTDGGTAHHDGGDGRVMLLQSNIEGNCPVGAVLSRATDVDTFDKQNKTYRCDDLLLHVQPENPGHESFNIYNRTDVMHGGASNYKYLHDMSTDYTISFWINIQEDTPGTVTGVFKTITNTSGNVGVQLGCRVDSSDNTISSIHYSAFAGSLSNAVVECKTVNCLTLNQWHHVSIAIDSSTLTGEVHVDGVSINLDTPDYGQIGPVTSNPDRALTLTGGRALIDDLRIDKTYSPYTTIPTSILQASTPSMHFLWGTVASKNGPPTYHSIPREPQGPFGRSYGIEDRSSNCIVWSDNNVVTQSSDGPYGEGSLYIPYTSQLKTDLPKSETNFLHNSSLGQEYTIEAWVKSNDWSSGFRCIAGTGQHTGDVGFQIVGGGTSIAGSQSGVLYARYTWGQSGNAKIVASPGGVLSNDTWHHVACQHDSNRVIQLFVDGVVVATEQLTFNAIPQNSHHNFYIGNIPGGHGIPQDVYVQGVRVTKGLVYSGSGVTTLHVPFAQELIKNYPVNTDNSYWGDRINFTTRQRIPLDQVMDVSVLPNQQYQSLSNQTDLLIQTAAGETISDKSYNQHAITIGGDATIDSTETLFGNDTINFDGSGDYLSIADKSAFKYIHNLTSEYTIEGWVYVDTITRDSLNRRSIGIVGNGGSSQFKGFQLYFGTTGLQFGTIDGNGSTGQGVTFVQHPMTDAEILNNWMHVAVVYDMSETRLYLNGTFVASSDVEQVTPVGADATHDLTIGYTPHGAGVGHYPMDGHIQYLRISKQAVYTNDFTPPGEVIDADIHIPSLASIPTPGTAGNSLCDDTVLQLQLIEGEVKDTTLYRHDITETGTVTEVDGMMQFDGSSHLVLPGGDHLDLKDNDFTIEFRMNTNSHRATAGQDTGTGLIDTYSGGAKTGWGYFMYTNEDRMAFLYTTSSAPHWKYLRIFTPTHCYGTNEIGREYHIAITRVGDKLSSYIDGKLVERVTETEAIQYTGQDLVIGKRHSGPGYHYIGSLNEIRIVNGQSLYTDEIDIMTPDRRLTTDDQATLHIQPHLDLECVETGASGGTDDDETPAPEPPDGETGASSAGVFVTDLTSDGITNKTIDDTQVAIGNYAPVVSAVVDDPNLHFTVEWEGASDEWTGYPTVSGHTILKTETSAIAGDQTIRRYRAVKSIDFTDYKGETITIPIEFKGSSYSIDVEIAGEGPVATSITCDNTYPHGQDHFKAGDDVTYTATFDSADVSSIKLHTNNDTATNANEITNFDSSTLNSDGNRVIVFTVPVYMTNNKGHALSNLDVKISATNSLGTEGDTYTESAFVPCMYGPVITDITFDADPYPGDQTELKSGDSINVHFTFDTNNVNQVQFNNSENTTGNTGKSISVSNKQGSVSVNVSTSHASDTQTFSKKVKARGKSTSSGYQYGDYNTSTNTINVNNQYPEVLNNGVTYPGGQNGIKAGETAQVSLEARYVGADPTYEYTHPTNQLKAPVDIGDTTHANDVYTLPKRAEYNSGNYNISTPNISLTVTRKENGASITGSAVVNIANVSPTITITSNNGTRMRSGGNDGTSAQNYSVRIDSDQQLANTPSIVVPVGTIGSWSANSQKTRYTSTLSVHDNDAKGTHTYTGMSATGITGLSTNVISSGADYVFGGFVSRVVNISAPSQPDAYINVLWSDYNKLSLTWSTGVPIPNKAPAGTTNQTTDTWAVVSQTAPDTGTTPVEIRILDYSATSGITTPSTVTIEEAV